MNKAILPAKINIATWIMIIDGIIILTSSIMGFFAVFMEGGLYGHPDFTSNISGIIFLLSIPFFPFGYFIFKKKKWAWTGSVLLLSLLIICFGLVIKYDYSIHKKCIDSGMPYYTEVIKTEYADIGSGEKVPSTTTYFYRCTEDLLQLFESRALFEQTFGVVLLPFLLALSQWPELYELYEEVINLPIIGIILFMSILLPIILFLYDRKKYWQIATWK